MASTWFIDANSLQALIESGNFQSVKDAAAARGINLATTDTVIKELGDGGPTSAVRDFVKNSKGLIEIFNDPFGDIDISLPENNNAGEKGLARLALDEVGAGRDAAVVTQDKKAIRGQSLRSSTDAAARNIAVRSFGELAGFNETTGPNRVVRDALDDVFNSDGSSHAKARDNFEKSRARLPSNSGIDPETTFKSNASLNQEVYTRPAQRYGANPDIEYRNRGLGPPPGEGWMSGDDARGKRPDISDLQDENARKYREKINDIRNNPSSFDQDGKISPEARAALSKAAKFAAGVGVALGLLDSILTGNKIADLLNQGKTHEAQNEAAGLAGRLFGGLWGAQIGAALAIGFGIAGPFGILAALLVGGFAGAVFGDGIFRNISSWLPDIFGNYFTNRDPLVFDLDTGDVSLRSLALSNAFFDLDNNDFAERTGWITPGEGLLALDVNGNGIIDNGSELFGAPTVDGFTILAQYDSNGDNQITSADAIWDQLLIWRDNGDAISTADELTNITAEDIVSIDLNDRIPGRFERSRAGNSILGISSFEGADGFKQEVIAAGFRTDATNTRFIIPDGFEYDSEVFGLPNLRGYGQLPDLWVAMTLDPVLKQMVMDFMAGDLESIEGIVGRSYSTSTPGTNRRRGSTSYHYEASAFDDILARWAGIPISAGIKDEGQAYLTAQAFLGRSILPDRGAGNPNFHRAFEAMSTELATRFIVGWADIEENRVALDLFQDILVASNNGADDPDPVVLQQLIDQAEIDIENESELSPFLQRYTALDYDFAADSISGDTVAFIDAELQSFEFNSDNPWEGWSSWIRERLDLLLIIDPDGSILDERRRAYTGNLAIPILLFPGTIVGSGQALSGFNRVTGDDGDNFLQGGIETGLNATAPDLINGGAGDDVLMGGVGSDTYVFADGSGNDIIIDAAGAADEVAFQGSLFSTLAIFKFVGNDNRDLMISFEGRDETVLIKGYFNEDGTPSIERISFADGPLLSQQSIRDASFAQLTTDGDDRIQGTASGETILGGAGNDELGIRFLDLANFSSFGFPGDVFDGGTGDDILQGAWGNDVFRFTRGDGHDIVSDIKGLDRIEFDDTITPDDIVIRAAENGEDIVISINGADQSITLVQFLLDGRSTVGTSVSGARQFYEIAFADGTIWTDGQITTRAIAGTAGDDVLFAQQGGSTLSGLDGADRLTGRNGDDIFIGGAGDDILIGLGANTGLSNRGRDEYRFSRGDGHDIVDNENSLESTISFDSTISPDDIIVTQGSDGKSVILSVVGESQTVTISDVLNGIDRTTVNFNNGDSWTGRELFTRSVEQNAGDDVFFTPTAGGELSGSEGNDRLEGRQGEDILSGDAGSDELFGGAGNDTLDGGADNDELLGGFGEDILTGGLGDDILNGGYGGNRYRFVRGDGHDVIHFNDSDLNVEIIEFDASIVAADITVRGADNGKDLILEISADQSITIVDGLREPSFVGNFIRFADDSELTFDQLLDSQLVSSDGDDSIFGTSRGDTLDGGAGNDELIGGVGDDILIGGTGNDKLSGGDGNNIFRFNQGDGQDIIVAGEGKSFFSSPSQDVVEFGPGLLADDISVSVSSDGQILTLSFAGLDDSLSLERRAAILGGNGEFRFADGSILNASAIFQLGIGATLGDDVLFAAPEGSVLEGLDGNDQLYGDFGSDTLDGGAGNDTLNGGSHSDILIGGTGDDVLAGGVGGDIYKFALGDGHDTIIENPPQIEESPGPIDNVIEFAEGIGPDDLLLIKDDSLSDLVILVGGEENTITIDNQFNGPPRVVEFRFADGTIWNTGEIFSRINNATIDDNTLVGSTGFEILDTGGLFAKVKGNGGSDTFIYNSGYGVLSIDQLNVSFGAGSTLILGPGILPEDIEISTNASGDVELRVSETDRIILERAIVPGGEPVDPSSGDPIPHRDQNVGDEPYAGVNEIRFDDGTIWTNEYLLEEVFSGSENRTTLIGDEYGVVFDSRGIAREIISKGNQDTIFYEQGYGALSIEVSAKISDFPFNLIYFEEGLSLDTAAVYFNSSNSLVLDFGNGDKVTVVGALNSNLDADIDKRWQLFEFFDDEFEFGDLVSLANEQMLSVGLRPESGLQEPTFFGDFGSNQTFDPSGSVSKIITGGANDLVQFNQGYGRVEIDATIPTSGPFPTNIPEDPRGVLPLVVEIGADLSRENLQIQELAGGKVLFDFGNGDELILANPFASEALYPDGAVALIFSDDVVWARSELLNHIGANFDPTTDQNNNALALQEFASSGDVGTNFALSGVANFQDLNLDDVHTISVANVSVSGSLNGLIDESVALSFLSLNSTGTVGDLERSYRWFFIAGGTQFEALANEESGAIEYAVDIDDGRGGVLTQTLTVNVTGTNDTPQFEGGIVNADLLSADLSDPTVGQILFSDVDLSDAHTSKILGVNIVGSAASLPTAETAREWFSLDDITAGNTLDSLPDTLGWNFAVADFDFSNLAPDEFLSISYQVEITDSAGDTIVQPIVITIAGAEAAPGALFALNNPPTPEDGFVDLELPVGAFANVLAGDILYSAKQADGQNLPDWLSFDGSRFSGNPPENFHGNIAILVTATNGSNSANDVFTLVIEPVDDAPIVQSILRDLSFDAAAPIDFLVPSDAFSDVDGDALTLTSALASGDPLPTWLEFDGVRFAGTPPVGVTGNFEIEIFASDGDLSTSQIVRLSVGLSNNAPSTLIELLEHQFDEDTPVVVEIPIGSFEDIDGDVLTLTAVAADGSDLPAWLSFNGERFTGIPPENFHGSIDIEVIASDGELNNSQFFTLTILPVNDAPAISAILSNLTIPKNSTVDISIPSDAFSDVDGDELSLTATLADGVALPSWLSFQEGRFFGAPPANFNGTIALLVIASDGEFNVNQSFDLTIEASNVAPVLAIALDDQNTSEDTAIDIAIPLNTFTDIDGDALTLSAALTDGSVLPAWLVFDGTRLTGTPPQDFNGVLNLTVTASDGELTTSDSFALTIDPVNDAPVLAAMISDQVSLEDQAINFAVPTGTFADIDGDSLTLSATLADGTDLPAWLNFDGSNFTGTPPLDFNGLIEIALTASDGALSASDLFALSISPVNDPPVVLTPLSDVSSSEDQAVDIAIPLDTFRDVDGDALNLVATLSDGSDLPAWLSFDGTRLTGTPPQDFNGDVALAITASDGVLDIVDNFILTIDPSNDAPIVLNPITDTGSAEDAMVNIALPSNIFGDVDGDALALSATLSDGSDLPAWLSFDGVRFTGTPPQDFNGAFDVKVTASDGALPVSDSFQLTINPVNDAPVIALILTDQSSTEDQAIAFALPANAFTDVDGDTLALSATLGDGTELPAWLLFDGSAFTGTPPNDFNGNLDIAVSASDGGLSVTQNFNLAIGAANDAPIVAVPLADQNVGEDTAIDIAIPTGSFTDIDGDTLTLSATLSDGSGLPGWLSFDGVRFVGTPPQDFNGTLNIQVSASDGELNVSDDFTLTIDPINDAPALAIALPDAQSDEDTGFDVTLPAGAFTDVDGDALTLSATLFGGEALPNWVSFDGSRFTGTPPTDFNGTLDIEVTASDGALEASGSFVFTIDPINDAPIAIDDDIFLSEGGDELTILQSSLLENDTDIDGDSLTVTAVTNGSNGTVGFDADGNIVYTPTAGFQGEDSFTYTISDGELTSTATAQIRVDDPYSGWRQGSEGRDWLFGNFFRQNRIYGRGGNDRIFGGFRKDYLAGGDGNDRIYGFFGNDHLWGNAGNDKLFGGYGTDTAYFDGTSNDYELITRRGGFYVRIRDEEPDVDGNDGRDQLYSIERLAFSDQTISVSSPIILDLDGDGTEFVSASESNALFDLDNDGVRDDTSWIGSGDAFLFLDRDGDGFVSGVNEISFVDDVEDARSDLDGLKSFDSNGDGILSADDDRFDEFGAWQDLDTDGEVDAGETLTLAEAGIVSIDLNATATDAGFTLGEVAIVNQGTFLRSDGTTSAYADAAITFFEKGVPELPKIEFAATSYGRKSKKYRLYSQNGELFIGSKKRATTALTGASTMTFRNRTIGLLSPVVLDLNGNGVHLVDGAKSRAMFDMDGNGRADDTGWIERGDGFLVVDRNNNGIIDNAAELSFLTEAPDAKSDLQALTAFDSNGDGLVSNLDVRFNELKIWVDGNSNGYTDAGELATLDDHGIASINLQGQATNNRVKVGKNIILANTTFTRTNGTVDQAADAVLSFTPSGDRRPQVESKYRNWSMEDFTRRVGDFGTHSFKESLSVMPEMVDASIPELVALRAGLDGPQVTMTNQGLSLDVPSNTNVFDHFEQPEAAVSAPSVTPQAEPSEVAMTTDTAQDEVQSAPTIAEESTGDNMVAAIVEEGATSNDNGQNSDAEVAANDNNGQEPAVIKRTDMLAAAYQGGPEVVDPDVLKIALMTQDMNVFGASSAATSSKERERLTPTLDYIAV